jgi:hypothetical protein
MSLFTPPIALDKGGKKEDMRTKDVRTRILSKYAKST